MHQKYRLHGGQPYTVIAIHGGPGCSGEARPFAKELAHAGYGVVEPFLLAETFEGQISELKAAIEKNAKMPAVLVGHSYGAQLGLVFAARYPKLVRKLIMVSSAVLDSKDVEGVVQARLSRLSSGQVERLQTARQAYKESTGATKGRAFIELLGLIKQADSYSLIPHVSDLIVIKPELYDSVWEDLEAQRDIGELVRCGQDVQCPVVAIHGDYDPRQASAIHESLAKHVKDLQFVPIKKCGHYPWYEQYAQATFYEELQQHVGYTSGKKIRENRPS